MKFPPRWVKEKIMNKIYNSLSVRSFMTVTLVFQIEIYNWVTNSIPIKVDNEVYMSKCGRKWLMDTRMSAW